jgi:type II secretory pathway component PulF
MDSDEIIIGVFVVVLVAALWFGLLIGLVALVHFCLSLPMRRAERARLFLDLIDSGLQQGQTAEQSVVSIAASRDLSMGARFHLVAAWIEQNVPLMDALEKVPRFLPPQVMAMLNAGRKIGDLRKVMPACRYLVRDAVSHTRAAINYLVILTFVITPVSIWVIWMIQIFVFPKFLEIEQGFLEIEQGLTDTHATGYSGLLQHSPQLVVVQTLCLLAVWCGAFFYTGGPRLSAWFPALHNLHFWVPWRRKRMQRDFSAMLAVLLDSGVPEADAVTLAAECTANNVFVSRAASVVEALQQGVALPQALQRMDDSGEFGWRLTNALQQRGKFAQALAGWQAWLDAKAFQQQQAAAHTVTSALVVWNGIVVGLVVVSVFGVLISIINAGILW